MEERSFLHLQGKKRGDLVAPNAFQRKLLPYEWGLIQALEISEQEYREIFQRLAEEQRKRSADYAHIPDVVNEPATTTAILVSLAIGLVSTGISLLLAPKPPSLRDDEGGRSILGSNQEGRTRFAQTIGFDGTPQLAQLGSRIPLIFGNYRKGTEDTEASGGIIAEPLLVWSQVLSKGTYQNFKGQYVVGEWGLDKDNFPEKQAYLMGGQPIDDIYEVNYELFFRSEEGSNVLSGDDSQYGEAAPGDLVFSVYNGGEMTRGFCSVYSPANKNVFGVHAPIRNGGRWSLNWRVINLWEIEGDDDEGKRIQNQRRKICGSYGDSQDEGMRGTGRWYSPQMGLEALSRGGPGNWEYGPDDDAWEPEANLGDYVKFRISPRNFNFPEDLRAETDGVDRDGVNYDDINSSLNSLRSAADDAMQPGEIFCCNQTLLQVTDRAGTFEPARVNDDKQDGRVTALLKVVGFTGQDHTIGIMSRNVIRGYGVMREGGSGALSGNIPGRREANWYSLVKFDMAQVVNTRICQVTEIGIKSRVYTRINGLCNFSDVPIPKDLVKYDDDNVSVNNGTVNKYTLRTSFFKLAIRIADDERNNSNLVDGYSILNVLFAVQGDTPTDKFNFIRIIPTPVATRKYEYRLIPITSTQVYRNIANLDDDAKPVVFMLDINEPLKTQRLKSATSDDKFSIQFHARKVTLGLGLPGYDPILDLEELNQAPGGLPGTEVTETVVTYDDPDCSSFRAANFDGPDKYQFAFDQACLETIFGSLDPSNDSRLPYGTRRKDTSDWYIGGKTVPMKLSAIVGRNRDDGADDKYGTRRVWQLEDAEFANPSDKKTLGDRGQTFKLGNVGPDAFLIDTDSVYWREYLSEKNSVGSPQCQVRIKATITKERKTRKITLDDTYFREWDNYAQIKEISPFDEISSSCDQGPEHEIMYLNESDGIGTEMLDGDFDYNNLTMFGVKFKSMNQTQQLQAMQIWLKDGITIEKRDGNTGPTDLLGDIIYFLLTAKGRGLRYAVPEEMVDSQSFKRTNNFLRTQRLFFNGAVSDLVNIRSYVNQLAPFFLCHLSIRNGKFFMTPAIPTDSAGAILKTAVPIAGYFNDGNIVDGSFKLQYLEASERKDFRCVVKYRDSVVNAIPQYKTIQMRYKDLTILPDQQEFDLTQFCTTGHHAKMVARYLLSSRRRIDHTVEFSTSPHGIALAPGDYIKVDTVSSPLETRISGRINDELQVIGGIDDGTYTATIYRQAADSVVTEEIVISGGRVTDETLRNSLLAIPLVARRLGVYMIEELSLDEEGMVQVKASHHPVDDKGVSRISKDLMEDDDPFTVLG